MNIQKTNLNNTFNHHYQYKHSFKNHTNKEKMIILNIFLLCLKIFFARILDVSISTVRTVYVLKGKTTIVAALAFLEITIWFLVAREALNVEKMSVWIVLAYSGGYTTGTIIGTNITKKYVKGNLGIQIISSKINTKDINTIKKQGFGVCRSRNF